MGQPKETKRMTTPSVPTAKKGASPKEIANPPSVRPSGAKASGIKMRGGGAATKGLTARGPMA